MKRLAAVVVLMAAVGCSSPPPPATLPPEIRPFENAETRQAPNGKARVTFLARGFNAFVARLEMDPGATVPAHRDATEEYIHIVEGSGTITIDGRQTAVSTGTTVFMPANAEVSFANGDAKLVALQVFAGPGPAAKYEEWIPVNWGK